MKKEVKITHKFDKDEGRYLFRLEGVVGGPLIYADSIEEGNAKMKELVSFGDFAKLVTFIKHKVIETIDSAIKQHEANKATLVSE